MLGNLCVACTVPGPSSNREMTRKSDRSLSSTSRPWSSTVSCASLFPPSHWSSSRMSAWPPSQLAPPQYIAACRTASLISTSVRPLSMVPLVCIASSALLLNPISMPRSTPSLATLIKMATVAWVILESYSVGFSAFGQVLALSIFRPSSTKWSVFINRLK